MAWDDPLSAGVRAGRRLCVLGAGVAAMAAPMPWQQWRVPCFLYYQPGGSWLTEPLGALGGLSALALLLACVGGNAPARSLLRRARRRALVAAALAVLWVLPLPFAPAIPEGATGAVEWTLEHRVGAGGALAAAVGAVWWWRAIAARLLDRGWRRGECRRLARRAVPSVPAWATSQALAPPAG